MSIYGHGCAYGEVCAHAIIFSCYVRRTLSEVTSVAMRFFAFVDGHACVMSLGSPNFSRYIYFK